MDDGSTRLLALMRRHQIAALDYEGPLADGRTGALTLRLPAQGQALLCPSSGRFRLSHPLSPAVALPRPVKAGDVIGFLQSGVLLRPLIAPAHGLITACLVSEDGLCGYGTPLLAFQPEKS